VKSLLCRSHSDDDPLPSLLTNIWPPSTMIGGAKRRLIGELNSLKCNVWAAYHFVRPRQSGIGPRLHWSTVSSTQMASSGRTRLLGRDKYAGAAGDYLKPGEYDIQITEWQRRSRRLQLKAATETRDSKLSQVPLMMLEQYQRAQLIQSTRRKPES
jgi:hypothetical protein